MFQYATGRQLANIKKTNLVLATYDISGLEKRYYELDKFPLIVELGGSSTVNKFMNINSKNRLATSFRYYKNKFFGRKIYNEPSFRFNSDIFKIKEKDILLIGYWQTEKYFKNIREELIRDFTFPHFSNVKNIELSEKIMYSESVAIHVRRGDYASIKQVNNFHGLCSLEYYKGAIEQLKTIKDNLSFYVFSDDSDWCKDNLLIENTTFIDWNGGKNSFRDMQLMSLCKHNIIANSSFSWWGAWLNQNNDKIVIAPKRWFADDRQNNETEDLIPNSWIRL